MNGYRFNAAVSAVGAFLVAVFVVVASWLRVRLGGDWPSWSRLVGEIIVGVVVMEATNAAAQQVWYWRNKAPEESEGQ